MNDEVNPGGSSGVLEDVYKYKCYSCLKVPEGQIFNCKKGHPICVDCLTNRDSRCLKCQDKLPVKNRIRNEVLEVMLDGMEFDCEFSGDGCKEKLPRQLLSIHFKTCSYREKILPQNNLLSTDSPSSSQDSVGTTATVVVRRNSPLQSTQVDWDSSKTAKSSGKCYPAPAIENEKEDCQVQVVGEKEYSVSRVTIDARTSSNDAIQIDADTSDENNSTFNDVTPFSADSDYGLITQVETPASAVESNTSSKTVDIINTVRKRKIYQDTENQKDTKKKKGVFDIFSYSSDVISEMTENSELVEHYTKCKIAFLGEKSSSKISKVVELFSKYGSQFEELFASMPCLQENSLLLDRVLEKVTNLKKLIYEYQHGQDALEFLTSLKVCKDGGNLRALTSLKLVGASGKEYLTDEHITKLSAVGIKFRSLEIGDSLWEDVKPATLHNLFENCNSSLRTIIIYGGFRGRNDKTNKVLTFPKMKVLTSFWLCPYYDFLSEINNPQCEKSRIVELDGEKEEPIKVTVKFQDSFPSLKSLALGNTIEVDDLNFSTIRKLTDYECGSFWNLSIQFPPESSRKSMLQSNVTNFQFPDALNDPSFPQKVAKHFPNLKRVLLYLPSVAVLQAFFKAFENSSMEKLYLRTQFDFASQLESCLFPELPTSTTVFQDQDEETKTLIKTLKEYKHFEEYATYYNLELPSEQIEYGRDMNSIGIASLKNLKVLRIRHIPRNLLIPVDDEEKKWYDPKCTFMNATIGFRDYPFEYKCHEEILKLNLEEYYPACMICKSTGKLYEGFIKDYKQAKADEEMFSLGVPSPSRVKMNRPSMSLQTMTIKLETE